MADVQKELDNKVNEVAQKTGQTPTTIYIFLAIIAVVVASKIFGF